MLIELGAWAIGSAAALTIKGYIQSDKTPGKLKDKLNRCFKAGAPKNKNENTFKCFKVRKIDKGYEAYTGIPVGLSYEQLEAFLGAVKTNTGAKYIELERSGNHANIKLYTEALESINYEPIECKPNELYIGYSHKGYVKVNMSTFTHYIQSGGPGTGKTRLLYIILTTLINKHSKKFIRIYLAQISKAELSIYRNCSQVDYVAMNLDQLALMLKNVEQLRKEREKLLGRFVDKGVFNIEDYNKKKTGDTMPYIYVVIDEFAFLMPMKTDSKEIKEKKLTCLNIVLDILRSGRSSGIFAIACLQQPDAESLPPPVKRLFQTVLSFRQPSITASMVALGDKAATELDMREALIQTNGRQIIKTPKIEYEDIMKYIKDSIEKDHKYRKLDETLTGPTEVDEDLKSLFKELNIE